MGSIDEGRCKVKIDPVGTNSRLFKAKDRKHAGFLNHYQPLPLVLRGYGVSNDITAVGVFAFAARTPPVPV